MKGGQPWVLEYEAGGGNPTWCLPGRFVGWRVLSLTRLGSGYKRQRAVRLRSDVHFAPGDRDRLTRHSGQIVKSMLPGGVRHGTSGGHWPA